MKRTFNSIFTFGLAIVGLLLSVSCSSDDTDFNYLNSVQVPSNLSLLVTTTSDNSGNVIFTPSALSASKFILDYGDGSEPESVVPGTNAIHAYGEGTLNVVHNNIENRKNLIAVVTNFEHTECSAAGHNKKRKVLGTVGEFNDITRSIVHQAKI